MKKMEKYVVPPRDMTPKEEKLDPLTGPDGAVCSLA
jgi:hypothetical protein